MQSALPSKWWKHRRVQWPLFALLALAAAAALAITRSKVSRIVVYNETADGIAELTISACGQSRTFRDVSQHDSVRLNLAPTGGESDISLTTNGSLAWRGEFIEPRGGYRAILRLRQDGQVDALVTVSWWQSSFRCLTGPSP